MADFFRSAFDYLNNTTSQDNEFVGQYVELGNQKLQVKSVIAEGKQYIILYSCDIMSDQQSDVSDDKIEDVTKNTLGCLG